MDEAIEILTAEIELIHGCASRCESYDRLVLDHGELELFEGDVFVFQIDGHPLTDTAFAWLVADEEGAIPFISLKYGPVVDAATAVEAAISLGAW